MALKPALNGGRAPEGAQSSTRQENPAPIPNRVVTVLGFVTIGVIVTQIAMTPFFDEELRRDLASTSMLLVGLTFTASVFSDFKPTRYGSFELPTWLAKIILAGFAARFLWVGLWRVLNKGEL